MRLGDAAVVAQIVATAEERRHAGALVGHHGARGLQIALRRLAERRRLVEANERRFQIGARFVGALGEDLGLRAAEARPRFEVRALRALRFLHGEIAVLERGGDLTARTREHHAELVAPVGALLGIGLPFERAEEAGLHHADAEIVAAAVGI